MKGRNTLRINVDELNEDEKAFLLNFLHSHLGFNVTTSPNEFFVESEKLSPQELERLVNKFIYHRDLNHKYWVSVQKDTVKINRLTGIKKHVRTHRAFPVVLWLIMLTISISAVTVLIGTFFRTVPSQNLVSLDWGGYVVVSDLVNPQSVVGGISGSWTVPTVTASQQDKFSAAWIGIGGQVDQTLIQTGTEQDSINGTIIYSAWYELLPDYSIEIPNINVYPGDKITASIKLLDSTTNEWSIEIDDVTQGDEFKQNFHYDSSQLSAEWIVERPTINNVLSSLADFGSITFTDASVTMSTNVGTVSDFPFSQVIIHDRQNRELVTVSSLASNGSSFTVSYLSTTGSVQTQDIQIEARTIPTTKGSLSKLSERLLTTSFRS